MSSLPNVTTRHVFLTIASLSALLALPGCRETVTCAEHPSSICPDAAGPGMDAAVDAFVRPDANLDAPGLDAWEPDSPLPPDAWEPDAWVPGDGGPCSRCPSGTPICDDDGITCVQCTTDDHCSGTTPACDTETNTCVACNVATAATDCPSPLAACLSHACVRCDDRMDCMTATDLPFCLANNCAQCENRSDCADNTGFPACTSNTCVQCELNTDCPTASASRCAGTTCAACTADMDCSHLGGTPVCDEGRGVCVQCTGDTEVARCGTNSCRRSDGTCTTRMRRSRDVCDSCEADSECFVGQHCVRHVFSGTDLGGFCFLDATAGCGNTVPALRPYRTPTDTTSIDGAAGMFCFPPSTTTCEGIRDTQSQSCTMSTDCGDSRLPMGTDDGFCPSSGPGAGLCSYRCAGAVDCLDVLTCAGTPTHCRSL